MRGDWIQFRSQGLLCNKRPLPEGSLKRDFIYLPLVSHRQSHNISMESESNGNGVSFKPLHVVAIPFPLQGHITPMFHFAKKLAAKGVIVTFVITEACNVNITKAYNGESPFSHARSLGLDIRSVQIGDGFPLEFDRSLNAEEFREAFHTTIIPQLEELIAHLKANGPSVSCIIADTFFSSLNRIANKFGISYASFWTQSTILFSIYYHWDLLVKNGHCPFLNHGIFSIS